MSAARGFLAGAFDPDTFLPFDTEQHLEMPEFSSVARSRHAESEPEALNNAILTRSRFRSFSLSFGPLYPSHYEQLSQSGDGSRFGMPFPLLRVSEETQGDRPTSSEMAPRLNEVTPPIAPPAGKDGYLYYCPIAGCGKKYRRRGDLKFHVTHKHVDLPALPCQIAKPKSEKLGKSFPCPLSECKCGFKWQRDLQRHVRAKHTEMYEKTLKTSVTQFTYFNLTPSDIMASRKPSVDYAQGHPSPSQPPPQSHDNRSVRSSHPLQSSQQAEAPVPRRQSHQVQPSLTPSTSTPTSSRSRNDSPFTSNPPLASSNHSQSLVNAAALSARLEPLITFNSSLVASFKS